MVRFFTIEREYGSEGAEFAAALAEKLGWKLYDKALIDAAAAEAGVDPDQVAAGDERRDPWYARLGRAFWPGAPSWASRRAASTPNRCSVTCSGQ